MDCSQPDSSVHGILQAKILEWVALPSSRGSSWPGDQTHISYGSCIAGGFFTTEPLGEAQRQDYWSIMWKQYNFQVTNSIFTVMLVWAQILRLPWASGGLLVWLDFVHLNFLLFCEINNSVYQLQRIIIRVNQIV